MEYEEKFQMLYLKKNVFFYSLMKDATTLRELLLLKLCPNLCPPTVCQWLLNSPKRYLSWFYTYNEQKRYSFSFLCYIICHDLEFLSFIYFVNYFRAPRRSLEVKWRTTFCFSSRRLTKTLTPNWVTSKKQPKTLRER